MSQMRLIGVSLMILGFLGHKGMTSNLFQEEKPEKGHVQRLLKVYRDRSQSYPFQSEIDLHKKAESKIPPTLAKWGKHDTIAVMGMRSGDRKAPLHQELLELQEKHSPVSNKRKQLKNPHKKEELKNIHSFTTTDLKKFRLEEQKRKESWEEMKEAIDTTLQEIDNIQKKLELRKSKKMREDLTEALEKEVQKQLSPREIKVNISLGEDFQPVEVSIPLIPVTQPTLTEEPKKENTPRTPYSSPSLERYSTLEEKPGKPEKYTRLTEEWGEPKIMDVEELIKETDLLKASSLNH